MSELAIYHQPRIAPDYLGAHYHPSDYPNFRIDHHPRPVQMGGRLALIGSDNGR